MILGIVPTSLAAALSSLRFTVSLATNPNPLIQEALSFYSHSARKRQLLNICHRTLDFLTSQQLPPELGLYKDQYFFKQLTIHCENSRIQDIESAFHAAYNRKYPLAHLVNFGVGRKFDNLPSDLKCVALRTLTNSLFKPISLLFNSINCVDCIYCFKPVTVKNILTHISQPCINTVAHDLNRLLHHNPAIVKPTLIFLKQYIKPFNKKYETFA